MSGFPTGVAVVTTFDPDGRPWGMTCSSVASVALDPPTLLICLRHSSPTLDAGLRHGRYAVNLLRADAQPVAELFASGAPNRFDQVGWHLPAGAAGPHLTDAAHAVADCRISGTTLIGDHTVVFGEVSAVRTENEPQPVPLLYGLRRYASWS